MARSGTAKSPPRLLKPAKAQSGASGTTVSPASILGVHVQSAETLRKKIESGLPYDAVSRLQRAFDLPMPALSRCVQIPLRTLARRRSTGRLLPTESERVFRMAQLLAGAERLFDGDRAAARAWLVQPNVALGGEAPLDVSRTEVGARQVEDLIGRLEHGVFP